MAKKESKKVHFECPNEKCNYLITVQEEYLEEESFQEQINEIRCPKCNSTGFKKVSDEKEIEIQKKELEEKKKELKEKDKLEKIEMKEKANKVVEYIAKERKKAFDDLSKKLMNKEITPKRFVALFYNISYDIMVSRKKEYQPDFLSERKTILKMGQTVLDLYNLKEEQEEIIEEYDIKQDEIYEVYNAKYIHKNDLLYQEYIAENKYLDYKRKRQEKLNKVKENYEKKETNRKIEGYEKTFKKRLKENIKKI